MFNLAVKMLHGEKVEGFEAVAGGTDEVQASVYAGVVVVVQRP